MRHQKSIWEKEHTTSETLPSLSSGGPSTSVIEFAQYLQTQNIPVPQRIVDIGCGKGRNALYLAQLGYIIYAMDYIEFALEHCKKKAEALNVHDRIHLYHTELDTTWPFESNFFDIAIDCFSSIDIETLEGRTIYKKEMLRTLKPGGYALVAVVSIEDEIESEIYQQSPGKEPNSTIWSTNGKFQKNYDEIELKEFYNEFEIKELQKKNKKAYKLGKNYTTTNFWMVLQKPL